MQDRERTKSTPVQDDSPHHRRTWFVMRRIGRDGRDRHPAPELLRVSQLLLDDSLSLVPGQRAQQQREQALRGLCIALARGPLSIFVQGHEPPQSLAVAVLQNRRFRDGLVKQAVRLNIGSEPRGSGQRREDAPAGGVHAVQADVKHDEGSLVEEGG